MSFTVNGKKRLSIIGAGDYFRMIGPGVRKNFNLVQVVDRGDYSPEPGGLRNHVQREAPDAVMIITPNPLHASHVEELAPLGVPIFLEKPIVTSSQDLDRIQACLRINPRLYCSDFYVDVWGSPLMYWLGKFVFPSILSQIQRTTAFDVHSVTEIGKIRRVEATILEGTGSAASFAGREWLWNAEYGGVLWDMGYHELILWFRALGEALKVSKVYRFTVDTAPRGASETFGEVWHESLAGIEFHYRVGKYIESGDDRAFRIIGDAGEITMKFGDPSQLILDCGSPILLAEIGGPCLDFTAAAFRDYVESDPSTPHGLDVAKLAVNCMLETRAHPDFR